MALPEQIRKQSEAVQELYKQLNTAAEQTSEGKAPCILRRLWEILM